MFPCKLGKTVKRQKEESIDRILRNETYMPESGLMVLLKKHLGKIPLDVLHGLEAILACKRDESDRKVCKRCGEEADRDCFGKPRCPNCDPPCPGCYDGN